VQAQNSWVIIKLVRGSTRATYWIVRDRVVDPLIHRPVRVAQFWLDFLRFVALAECGSIDLIIAIPHKLQASGSDWLSHDKAMAGIPPSVL
jgi:hypothetical protein